MKIALKEGIINVSDVQEQIDMINNKKILSEHKYSIWQGTNGKWYTYLPNKEKGKVLKKRTSKTEIEKVVIQYYKEIISEPRVNDTFFEWINSKLELGEISNSTYDRYIDDYKRFINGKKIETMKISDLTEVYLEEFIKYSIKEFNLTSKAYSGLRLILRGMLKYAKKRGLTQISSYEFFGDLELSKTLFLKNRKEKETQVFSIEEEKMIMTYLENNPCQVNYGIMLAFQTGLRVGELCTLKFTDIVDQHIRIRRTEIRHRDKSGKQKRYIKDFPKSDAGWRDVFLTPKSLWILKKLKEFDTGNEFIFSKDDRWIYETTFDYYIRKACNKCGITVKSMHKIRKTYGTILLDADVDESIIMEQMGHSDIKCTKQYYYFSNKNQKNKEQQLNNALSV